MNLSGYQTGDEIERGDNSVLYAAVAQNKGREAVIRLRWAEHGSERDAVLAGIKRQEAACSAGVPCLAPILAYGQTPTGVYYVTTRHTRSVHALVHAKIAVRPQGLTHLTRCVLSALKGLNARRIGAHGNLKTTNILVQGTGRLRDCTVAITDFSGKKELPFANDIYALGMLILQLVRRRHIASPDWPVPASEDWETLEGEGDRWREFCSFLLDPARAKESDPVASAAREFRRMRGRTVMGTLGSGLFWGTAALVVLGGGGWATRNYLLYHSPSPPGTEVVASAQANADLRWCGMLAREIAAAPERELGDAWFKREIATPLRALRLSGAAADALAAGHSEGAVAATCQKLNGALVDWPAKASINPAYDMFAELRWNNAAVAISKVRRATFSEDIPISDQIDLIARTAHDFPVIESTWQRILSTVDRLEETRDPVLSKIRGYATSTASMTALEDLPKGLREIAERLSDLEQLWKRVDKAKLGQDGKFSQPITGTVDAKMLKAWEENAQRFQMPVAGGK